MFDHPGEHPQMLATETRRLSCEHGGGLSGCTFNFEHVFARVLSGLRIFRTRRISAPPTLQPPVACMFVRLECGLQS